MGLSRIIMGSHPSHHHLDPPSGDNTFFDSYDCHLVPALSIRCSISPFCPMGVTQLHHLRLESLNRHLPSCNSACSWTLLSISIHLSMWQESVAELGRMRTYMWRNMLITELCNNAFWGEIPDGNSVKNFPALKNENKSIKNWDKGDRLRFAIVIFFKFSVSFCFAVIL